MMNKDYVDFIIDFETFGNRSNAAVIDVSVITFNGNPEVIQTFDELVAQGFRVKFNLASQKGQRVFGKSTLEWWKNQSAEARKNLAPLETDMGVVQGTKAILDHLSSKGINVWESQGWCRGQSFDFPILIDCISDTLRAEGVAENEIDTFKLEPCKFWNQRDIRTAIESLLLVRNLTTIPLHVGTLKGFIAHDSIHDCAKDILMLKSAQRYALGLEECPVGDEVDPLSLPKGRG